MGKIFAKIKGSWLFFKFVRKNAKLVSNEILADFNNNIFVFAKIITKIFSPKFSRKCVLDRSKCARSLKKLLFFREKNTFLQILCRTYRAFYCIRIDMLKNEWMYRHLDLLSLGQMVGDHVLVRVQPRFPLAVGVRRRRYTLRRRLVLNITFCGRARNRVC